MKTAFKEWAVVCRALGAGRQALILRKGGIREGTHSFRPEHREFLLFPTAAHQSPEQVRPEAHGMLRELDADQVDGDHVTFRHYAVVSAAIRVESLGVLLALHCQHIWSDSVVEERFCRWQENAIDALIVRVYALPTPVTIPMMDRYSGCKSWVGLAVDVNTAGAVPVLTDDAFGDRRSVIQNVLDAACNEGK